MEHKFKVYDIKNKKTGRIIAMQDDENNIWIQNTGIQDRKKNDVFDGDYLLYDTGILRDFMKVKRGKVEFAFYRWNKYDKRWRKSTYQGVETYGETIGNIYEGIKSKRLYNEMQDLGIFN